MRETIQDKGWLGLFIAGGVAATILLIPTSTLAASNSNSKVIEGRIFKVIDEDEFPSSSFGAPPTQRDLAILPHRPNPLAYDQQEDVRGQGRSLASASNTDSASSGDPTQFRQTGKSSRRGEQKTIYSKTASNAGFQEIGLIAGDLGFFPQTVFVAPEVPVRLYVTGASKKPLCLMMDDFQIRKQVRAQKIEEITFTPMTPGQYRFYCPVNGIEGTLLVKEKSYLSSKKTHRKAED